MTVETTRKASVDNPELIKLAGHINHVCDADPPNEREMDAAFAKVIRDDVWLVWFAVKMLKVEQDFCVFTPNPDVIARHRSLARDLGAAEVSADASGIIFRPLRAFIPRRHWPAVDAAITRLRASAPVDYGWLIGVYAAASAAQVASLQREGARRRHA